MEVLDMLLASGEEDAALDPKLHPAVDSVLDSVLAIRCENGGIVLKKPYFLSKFLKNL